MKAALYARVSTADKGQDPEVQLKDLRAYARHRRWEDLEEYVDVGQSGAKEHRPELDRLLTDARRGKVQVILVWRLDRLGRSLKHLVNLLSELHERNVALVSFQESLDLSTSTGKLMFHVIAALAEFERDLIRERVKAGLAHARSRGVALGRRSKIDAGVLRTIQEHRGRGESIRAIAKALGISPSLVHKTLKNSPSEKEAEIGCM